MSLAIDYNQQDNDKPASAGKLAKRPRRTFTVQSQAPSYCERIFGMSESDLKLIVGELVGAAKTLKENTEKQEKKFNELEVKIDDMRNGLNTRITNLEDLVKNAKFLRFLGKLILYPIFAFIFSNIDKIWAIIKKIL